MRGAKHTNEHVANIHAEHSPAKSFHNQLDALPSSGTQDLEAVSKPTQTHILRIDKPESFKDLERTTGSAQPQSNLLGTPPNVEAFPPNPPAITIHKPNIETEKPGRAAGANGETTIAGGIARPGDGTEASPKDKLPTINFPTGGDRVPLEKLPAGNNINVPIDKFPKPGDLILSPIDVKGPKNKDTIDLPVTGIPHIGDKFPSPANVHLGTINVGKEPEHKLHSDPAVSTLPVQPTFGLPLYTSINDAKAPGANNGNGQIRELPATTFSRTEPVNTVAPVSRYSSQEWMSSIASQTRTEEKAKTVTEQERQHTETQRKELQKEQNKELQKAPVEKSQAQAQIDSFRAKNEQAIPSEALRNSTLIAYNAIPQGAAEKVFAGKSLVAGGETQLMRNTSAAKNAEMAMPQPFKLSNMDKALFVPPNHKATNLEATVRGVQRESGAIANIGKIEFAAKRAVAAAEHIVATQQQRTLERVSAVKALDVGKGFGESKIEPKVDLSQGKSAQKMSGLAQRNEILVSAEKVQQNRSAILSEQAKVDETRRLDSSFRNDLQLRFDPTAKVDATKQRVVDLAQSKIETALTTNHKFVQIKPELISITGKADSNSALIANYKLDRAFANKIVFAGTVAADSMVVIQNTRKTAAGAGEIGCAKKGENNRFFPGAELTLAAVLSLSGARKRRREEQSQITTSASNEMLAKQVLHRRTHMVEAGDTLQSISERFYDTREAAGLIADLNAMSITQQSMDGRTIIELRVRQILELPEAEEVSKYLATLSKNYNVEKLVTIVKENNVDVELLRDFLGKVCDDKAAPEGVSALAAANSVLPAKPELPELVIEDDKTLPPANGLGAVVTDLAMLISNGLKRPTRDLGALS